MKVVYWSSTEIQSVWRRCWERSWKSWEEAQRCRRYLLRPPPIWKEKRYLPWAARHGDEELDEGRWSPSCRRWRNSLPERK